MTPRQQEYIKAWLQNAADDLASAQRLLEIEPMILNSACFHCQQATEKSLKAFLFFRGNEAKRTHDLSFLIDQCAQFDTIFEAIDILNLNEFAVNDARYPGFNLTPDAEEARTLYQLALEINSLVKERIIFP